MKIYLDLILLLNFFMDLLLLFTVSIILKRNVRIIRLILGALFGASSIFLLFININSITLFILKFIISLVMLLISFGYKDIKYMVRNILYLYVSSIILGGFLYYLNIEFSYKSEGIVFYHNGLSVNYIVLIVLSPIILTLYIRQSLYLKNTYSKYYKIDIYLKNGNILKFNSFLDTGNKLYDPYMKRPILLIDGKNIIYDKYIYVPYSSINMHGLLKCIVPNKIYIHGIGYRTNLLIGISNEKIMLDGVDAIMHEAILEG